MVGSGSYRGSGGVISRSFCIKLSVELMFDFGGKIFVKFGFLRRYW